MPYIEAKFSKNLDDAQKNNIQSKLTDAVCEAFSKPKAYVMADIEDGKSLFMAGNTLENGAYLSIKLFGNPSKNDCTALTQKICSVLNAVLSIEPKHVYVTYHGESLWGWNGMMF